MKKLPLGMLVLVLFLGSIGWAASPMELVAPGGGEMDLIQNLAKYYGVGSKQVEAHWGEYLLLTDYLEYYRGQGIIKAKGQVQLVQNTPEKRHMKCREMKIDLNKNLVFAYQGVEVQFDKTTTLTGGSFEWDRTNDWFKLTEDPRIDYQDWKLSGKIVEGKPRQGTITIIGMVYGANNDTEFKAGKLIADRNSELFYLQDNPAIIRGKNELSAAEIIYDLKTKRISAKGVMKSKTSD